MNIIKYTLIILVISITSSCNDDFIQRDSLEGVTNEVFWKTEGEVLAYNNSFYNLIADDDDYPILMGLGKGQNLNFYEGLWWQDEMSDNLGATHPRAVEMYKVRAGKHNVQSEPRIMGYKGWDLIRAINFGLINYDRVGLGEDQINPYKGEARLFRGWFMADKISKFGTVIWLDKPLEVDSPELVAPRDTRDFVMERVLEDLDFAITTLPESWETGRVDKWVALAVKSRICLFEGTWRKYHGLGEANRWLEESVAAATELMDTGGFEIYNTGNPQLDYRHAHWQSSHDDNKEIIYWRRYEGNINGHFASRLFLNYNGGATKSFVDDFLCEDGLPITLSMLYQGDAQIEDVFVNRDPRLRQCVLHPEDKASLSYPNDDLEYPRLIGMSGGRRSNTGYHVIKHWNAEDEQRPRNQHIVSPPTLRLGEVLLNYAEAKAELGTITQADLDRSVNLLRARAGIQSLDLNPPMDPRYAADGVSALIVEIRRERRVELFLEGHRYNDIRRWKQGSKFRESDYGILWDDAAKIRYFGSVEDADKSPIEATMIDGKPYIDVRVGTGFEPEFDESKHYLWPLPTDEIALNPNLGQNPGW